jgi:hypothetical protein
MRTMRSPSLLVAAIALSSSFVLAGCKQGIGDRCQVTSDCEDGLFCQIPSGGSPQSGGVCVTGVTPDGGLVSDQSVPADQSGSDH